VPSSLAMASDFPFAYSIFYNIKSNKKKKKKKNKKKQNESKERYIPLVYQRKKILVKIALHL
jgi:hypothetical protein